MEKMKTTIVFVFLCSLSWCSLFFLSMHYSWRKLRLPSSSFFRALRCGVFYFFCRCIIHGENCERKSRFFGFFQKSQNMSHGNGSSTFVFQVMGILKPVTVSTDKGLQLFYSPMVGCHSLFGSNFDFRMTYFDFFRIFSKKPKHVSWKWL